MSYIGAKDLAAWIGIEDSQDDQRMQLACDAASRAIDQYCGQTFEPDATVSARHFYPTNMYIVRVDPIGDTTDASVDVDQGYTGVYNQHWVETRDFLWEPLDGIVDGVAGFPFDQIRATGVLFFPTWGLRPRIQVTARWNWTTVPADVGLACRIKAAKLFKRYLSPDGTLGTPDFGFTRVSRYEDPDVAMLLQPYRAAMIV